jgi:hypothetical protein
MIAVHRTNKEHAMSVPHHTARPRVVAAAALAGGAVLANIAFVWLGSSFGYPDVLLEPTELILTRFIAERSAVMAGFALLMLGAALMAPAAMALGRLATTAAGRWSVRVGVAAAAVQVVGLSRWLVIVPGLADDADTARSVDRFELAHDVLGKLVGETLGYAFTAAWTVLVIVGFRELRGGRAWTAIGAVAAALIAGGVFTPLGAPGTDLANFVGYVLWSVWALALAVRLVRRGSDTPKHDEVEADQRAAATAGA